MLRIRKYLAVALSVAAIPLCGCKSPYLGVYEGKLDHPEVNVIPDEKTAIEVAMVILKRIYGSEAIEKQKPFKVTLDRGVWVVEGYFPNDGKTVGGSAYIGIKQKDGTVVFWNHGV